MKRAPALILILCFLASAAYAQPEVSLESQISQLTQMVHELKSTVEKQQQEINELRRTTQDRPVLTQAPAVQNVPSSARPSGKFTPEIGAVADVVFKSDSPKTDTGGSDRVSVREVELVLGSVVDPFSRMDATVAFNEDSTAELEEAYLTRFQLPFDMTARIGRFKPRIGKDLALHRDSLDTVDEPLVIQRYFGAEGMNKSGVDVTKLLDLPSPLIHQLTLGVLEGGNGEGGTAFGETKRRPTLYGRLKNFLDISDATNLEIGFSDAIGSRDPDSSFEVNVLGIDGTLIHHLNANQDLKLQTEIFNLNRKESFVDVTDSLGNTTQQDLDGNVWGGYVLADFRINSQWAAGFRYDQVEIVDRPAASPEHADHGYSIYATFYQSEFARWRAQFSHFDLTNGSDDNQVLLAGTFAIGDHKHKLQ